MTLPRLILLLFAALLGEAVCAQSASAAQQSAAPPTETPYAAAALYNLANSYARAGKPGLAVLNYERAALLAPNDADIQTNLKIVRATLHSPEPTRGRLETIAGLAAPATVAWLGILGTLTLGGSLLAARLSPRGRALWLAGSLAGLAAIGFTIANAVFWAPKLHEAVVIAATTPIRATPVPMGDPLQQLTEAQTVTVIQRHEDFLLVRTASGRSGWVARADLADVVPNSPVR